MATDREQAQAKVYRMESEVRTAKGQVDLRRRQLAENRDDPRAKGNIETAEAALRNAERALDDARAELRRT